MKKIAVFLCIAFLLTSCGSVSTPPVTSVESPSLTESVQAPSDTELSHELAMLKGYVVMDEGDVRHNAGVWSSFLNDIKSGKSSTVTVVAFTQDDSGYNYIKYDLIFDGSLYTVSYNRNGEMISDSAAELVYQSGELDSTMEPYDMYERYCLNDLIVYNDFIAQPDFEGVEEIFLHDKEHNPPIRSYTGAELQPVFELLMSAEYVAEPDFYLYGMKLLMTNRDGKDLVIELDLKQGFYRYGMQTYFYGDVADMFAALGIEQWPDSVLTEFAEFLD